MLRRAYRLILRLHPEPFRTRFGDEMLWIFDQEPRSARFGLVLDGVGSLARQRFLRSDEWGQAAVAVRSSDSVPLFQLIEAARPKPHALLNGLALTAALFFVVALIITYGRPSGLIHLPHVIVPSSNAPLPTETPAAAARRIEHQRDIQAVIFAFKLIDANGDGIISAEESAPNAAERMRGILACADQDADGEITLAEFDKAIQRGEQGCGIPQRQ